MLRTTSLLVGLVVCGALGCMQRNSAEPDAPRADIGTSDPRSEPGEEEPAEPGGFAADRGAPKDATLAVPFDGKRAMRYLEAICRIGPRQSGTEGMKKQQEFLQKHFEDLGAKVELQKFTARQKSQKQPVEMANLIARWNPEAARRVIICSHYDTRPIADQEPDRKKWLQPFVSANDGGSGLAVMMELAHHMKDLKTQVGVDFVCFDGEEWIFEPENDKYFFGSEYFAEDYKKNKPKFKYLAAVLLDMVAGKGAEFPIDRYSQFAAGPLVRDLWMIAAEQKCKAFVPMVNQTEILDDHIALNRAGIPAVDIIDFSYAHWHKLTDVPENCSPEPMEQVARVLTVWLQRVK